MELAKDLYRYICPSCCVLWIYSFMWLIVDLLSQMNGFEQKRAQFSFVFENFDQVLRVFKGNKVNMAYFQMLTNVSQKSKTVVLMLCAVTWTDLTRVNVKLDILETDGLAKVMR